MSVTGSQPKRKTRWDDAARARERELLDTMATEPKDSPAYSRARDELVTIHLPLVEHLARRFRDRGEPHDDLVQVGTIGLIKAVASSSRPMPRQRSSAKLSGTSATAAGPSECHADFKSFANRSVRQPPTCLSSLAARLLSPNWRRRWT